MILKSLIEDERKLTIDCCKATIKKNMTVEIPDEMFRNAEVQGAIKLGFVKVIGDEPKPQPVPAAVMVPEKKLKNVTTMRISLDCIKGLVMPGCYIDIPVDKIEFSEVQNAIQSGWLVDEENPLPPKPLPSTNFIPLEELTVGDIQGSPSQGKKGIKKVASFGESDDLYRPSEIHESKGRKPLKGAKAVAPDQPSKIFQKPVELAPKKQTVSEELVDFLDGSESKEPTQEQTQVPASDQTEEGEKPAAEEDPLGFLLS